MARVTINDIAGETGLARATVAQILSDRPGFHPETRERVLATAKRLNYRPNYLSKALAGGPSMAIGLLPASLSAPIGVVRLQAAEVAARAAGWITYMIGWDEANAEDDEAVARGLYELIDRRVDGVIVYRTVPLGPRTHAALSEADVPIVFIDRVPEGLPGSHHVVRIDRENAMHQLGHHLAELGHRRAAYLQAPFDRAHPHRRAEPYQRIFAGAGIEVDLSERWWLPADRKLTQGAYERVSAHLNEPSIPSVLLTTNDSVATAVLAAAYDAGWRVPRDLSVVGFDDLDAATLSRPALTTIRQPGAEVGRAAFDLLHQLMTEASVEPEPVTLECECVIRDSTGLAPGAAGGS